MELFQYYANVIPATPYKRKSLKDTIEELSNHTPINAPPLSNAFNNMLDEKSQPIDSIYRYGESKMAKPIIPPNQSYDNFSTSNHDYTLGVDAPDAPNNNLFNQGNFGKLEGFNMMGTYVNDTSYRDAPWSERTPQLVKTHRPLFLHNETRNDRDQNTFNHNKERTYAIPTSRRNDVESKKIKTRNPIKDARFIPNLDTMRNKSNPYEQYANRITQGQYGADRPVIGLVEKRTHDCNVEIDPEDFIKSRSTYTMGAQHADVNIEYNNRSKQNTTIQGHANKTNGINNELIYVAKNDGVQKQSLPQSTNTIITGHAQQPTEKNYNIAITNRMIDAENHYKGAVKMSQVSYVPQMDQVKDTIRQTTSKITHQTNINGKTQAPLNIKPNLELTNRDTTTKQSIGVISNNVIAPSVDKTIAKNTQREGYTQQVIGSGIIGVNRGASGICNNEAKETQRQTTVEQVIGGVIKGANAPTSNVNIKLDATIRDQTNTQIVSGGVGGAHLGVIANDQAKDTQRQTTTNQIVGSAIVGVGNRVHNQQQAKETQRQTMTEETRDGVISSKSQNYITSKDNNAKQTHRETTGSSFYQKGGTTVGLHDNKGTGYIVSADNMEASMTHRETIIDKNKIAHASREQSNGYISNPQFAPATNRQQTSAEIVGAAASNVKRNSQLDKKNIQIDGCRGEAFERMDGRGPTTVKQQMPPSKSTAVGYMRLRKTTQSDRKALPVFKSKISKSGYVRLKDDLSINRIEDSVSNVQATLKDNPYVIRC
uniref:Uncharacterized protein n=1 Tax=Megaviridae environmental sample TaxID=1737588 RepID=A0A5J6VJM1_9VIRU|nr:MAG: hypothetical protein [Megaviridae environmental sample]